MLYRYIYAIYMLYIYILSYNPNIPKISIGYLQKKYISPNIDPICWLLVWNMAFIFLFSWECHHPN